MTAKQPDLVLHVGMQQSGAGMLGTALGKLRPQLRERGVTYVSQSMMGKLVHHKGQANRNSWDPLSSEAFAKELRGLVDDERRKTSAVSSARGPVLISSDVLLGAANIGLADVDQFRPLAARSIGQLVEALGATQVRVVLITHRQDRLMEYSYLRDVQSGRWGEFNDRFPKRFTPLFDYVDLIQRITDVPNVTDIRVRPVELIGDDRRRFVDDFLANVGLKGLLDLDVVPADLRVRNTYSSRGMQIALGMNPHLETPRDRDRLRTFILENFAAENDRQARFLDWDDRRRIVRAHRASNRILFSTYLPELPPDSYQTDEATRRLAEVLPPVRMVLRERVRLVAEPRIEAARAETRRVVAGVRRRIKRWRENR